LDSNYQKESGPIHANLGCIVEQTVKYKRNKQFFVEFTAESIHGFKGAKYKSFKTIELAKKAYSENYEDYKGKTIFETELSDEELKLIGKPNLNTISVDAACNMQNGQMEYQGVETKSKKVIFKQGPHKGATNNIGEFLALVHAVALMKKNGDKRPIYSDSKTAIGWIKHKRCNTYADETEENKEVFDLIKRAENWLENNEIPYGSTFAIRSLINLNTYP
jgi:ribonuclease HI